VGIVESMPCHLSELERMSRQLKSRSSRAPFLLVGTVYSPGDDDARCLATLEGWLIDRTLCWKTCLPHGGGRGMSQAFPELHISHGHLNINVLNRQGLLASHVLFPC
jgi:hypothetical protein